MTQIFISYSREDLKFVEGLTFDLKNAGFEVWYDYLRLRGGERWRTEIQTAIRNCQSFITVLSPDSVESEWVEREFLFASSLERRIIPLLYRDCELSLNYIDLNYIDVRGENYRRNFNKILEVLNGVGATRSSYIPSHARIRSSNAQTQASRGNLLGKGLLPVWIPTLAFLLCLALSAGVAGYQFLLRPTLQNSDGDQDGMTYAEEIAYGCDPNNQDSDNDGLIDDMEKEWRTYCDKFDSDNDNLSDGEEVLVRHTDPTVPNIDGGGVPTGEDQAPLETSTPVVGTVTSGPPMPTSPEVPTQTAAPIIISATATLTLTSTPTSTNTPTATNTHTPTATKFPIDLYALAPNALWTSRAGNLIFGGPDTDARGFAMYRNGVRLEDGTTPAKVLYTHPEWVDDGYISGLFPSQIISNGARFRAQIGFLANPDGSCSIGNVKFELLYRASGGQLFFSLGSWTKGCDGRLQIIDIGVNGLAGNNVQFVLQVQANGVSWDDWAVWVNPRIEY